MRVETFYNLNSLIRAVEAISGSIDTITIDLFDTLLIRRVANPDQVKIPVAQYIAMRAGQVGIRCTWQTCLQWRAEIEQAHRQKNGAIYPDHEARYPEFMSELLARIFGNQASERLLREVTEWELKLEQAMIVPRAELLQMIQRLHRAGKAIWGMTDMYLPSTHIRPLADHAGLSPHLTGIVSSADACMAKASGAGFQRLQAQYHLDPARWLHIGDNPVSDGVRPASLGIRAFVLRDATEAHRKAIYRRYEQAAASRPFWKGRLVQQVMLPLEAENVIRDPLYGIGYHFFGLLAGAFVQHIAERARELNLRRIYFFSREGLTLMKVWEKAAPWMFPAGGAPEVRYLYVSRMALARATCAHRGLTHADAPLALLPARNRDLRDIFRVFGLNLEGLKPFLDRHGLPADAPLNPIYSGWTEDRWHRFDLLLKDAEFQEAVKQQTQREGRMLERYLEQEGFFELPEVAVVDIGWLGTIQRFLYEAIEHRQDKPKLHGFLLAATRGIPYPTTATNYIEGFIFDRDRSAIDGNTVTYALNVFEEAFRAPHAGVEGYEEKDGRVHGAQSAIQPILQAENHPERIMEKQQDAHYASIQRAILDAAEKYAPAVALLGVSSAELKPWLNHVVAMRLAFPRSEEVRLLQWKHHVDQYNGTHEPPLRIKLYLLRLWDLKPWMMRIPGLRLGFYGWTTLGLPGLRLAMGLWNGLKHRIGKTIRRGNKNRQD